MAKNMRLSLILSANDRLSSVIRSSVKKSDEAFSQLEARLDKVAGGFESIGKKSLVAGGALMAGGVMGVKNAAAFEDSMANVSTLIDTNAESMKDLQNQVLSISKRTPVALDQLSGALYDIRSAGISASDQFSVLGKSAQLGVAGLGSTKEATDLVTSSINAFNLKGQEQAKLYDTIFKVVKFGKTNISGLAQGFGAVAGTVAAAGIKIDDYMASISAMTTVGQPAAQAHTQMKAAIAGLTRNTKEQQAIFRQLGAKDFNDLIAKSGSVVGAFEGINRCVKGNKSKLIELLGSIEAYNALLSLTGNQNKTYLETIDAMRNGEDLLAEAYQKKLSTTTAQVQRARNVMSKISIDFGNALLPSFGKVIDGISRVAEGFDRMPDGLKRFVALSTTGLGVGLVAFGTLSMVVAGSIKQFKEFLGLYRSVVLYMKANNISLALPGFNALTNILGKKVTLPLKTFSRILQIDVGQALRVASVRLYTFGRAQLAAFPSRALTGLKALGQGLISLPKNIGKATVSIIRMGWAFLTNPATASIALIAGGALLIYKYWKPITGFFKGVWNGVVEATQPLQPIFQKVGNLVKPLFHWFSRLIKPVDDVGGKAESFGKKIGIAIGGAITGIVNFIGKVGEVIKKIVTLNGLIGGKKEKSVTVSVDGVPVDGSHANGLARVPYDGYVAELHEGERVLTQREALDYNSGFNNSAVYHVVFNPVIHAENARDIKELEAMVERLQRKFLTELKTEERRKKVRAYES